MKIHVILYGCAAKPELSDEIKGFFEDDQEREAQEYVRLKNMFAKPGYSYWYETIERL